MDHTRFVGGEADVFGKLDVRGGAEVAELAVIADGKNDVADLTPTEKRQLKAAISTELDARRKMRERRKRQ